MRGKRIVIYKNNLIIHISAKKRKSRSRFALYPVFFFESGNDKEQKARGGKECVMSTENLVKIKSKAI